MSVKVKPTIQVGGDTGISIGVQVTWGDDDQHRHRKVPGSKNWERRHRFDPPPTSWGGVPADVETHAWNRDIIYYDAPSPTVESEFPDVGEAEYPYEVYYPPEHDAPPPPREDDVFRGPIRVPRPGGTSAMRTAGWQIVLRVLWEIMQEVWERDKATKHRWDPANPQVIQRERDMPWIYDPDWKPARKRAPRVWIPPEWEPPPRVVDKVTKEIGVEMGRIVIGPLVLAEPDSILVWDPIPVPGTVKTPGGEVRVRKETRGTSKQPVIVMEPTPRAARGYRRYKWKVNPAHEWFPEAPPTPAPAPQPIPQMPPPAPRWANGVLIGAAAVAVASLDKLWDVLPDLHLSTVHGGGLRPRIEVAVASGRPNRPGMWDAREHKLGQDQKTRSQLRYIAILRFINRTWGVATEVGDFAQAVLKSTHDKDGRKHKFGYKRWDDWLHGIRTGRAEVDWDELILRALYNEVQDKLIGRLSHAAGNEAAKATTKQRQTELRGYVSMSRHWLHQLPTF